MSKAFVVAAVVLTAGLITGLATGAPKEAPGQPMDSASQETEKLAAERFTEWIRYYKKNKLKVTEQEMSALQTSHRILRAMADEPQMVRNFWTMVRQDTAHPVSWDEAKKMIVKGEVVSGMASHSGSLSLVTKDGRHFVTKEPKVDSALDVTKVVDPKMVFIRLGME